MLRKFLLTTSLALAALAAAGCAADTVAELPTAAELYSQAKELAASADFDGADKKFDELVSTYPTSVYSQQAILDQIFLFHRRREYALAIDTANQFMQLYPDHAEVPYALYMKGVVYFRENRGLLDYIGKQDPSSRAQDLKRLSFEAFEELTQRFPESKYAPDAAKRMSYLINALARNEALIANFYYKQGAYLAVINRAKNILRQYPDSVAIEEALLLLERAYANIGADDAAADTRRILEANFGKYREDELPEDEDT